MKINNNILIHAIPLFLLLIAVEIFVQRKEHRYAERKKDVLTDLGIGLVATIISFLTKGVIVFVYSLIYQYRFFDMPPTCWWTWVICFLGDDLSWYWFHRLSHQVRFLWASHAVHHSPETFSLSGGMRVPWTSNLSGNFLFWAWMPLLGIEPAMIVLMKTLSVIYQFWLHTEMIRKMPGWFEIIFNTPSHHRVHHGSEVDYLDKNHGGFLIIWDKLFRTFQREIHTTKYGLTKTITSTNPFFIAVHEWKNLFKDFRKAKKLKDYLNYFFNSPGWSNDGSSKTTKQLRASTESGKDELVHN